MTKQQPLDDDHDRFEVVFELQPNPEGHYLYKREDGWTVNRDPSGEWTLDEDGEVDDVVFFVSPGWMRRQAEHSGRE